MKPILINQQLQTALDAVERAQRKINIARKTMDSTYSALSPSERDGQFGLLVQRKYMKASEALGDLDTVKELLRKAKEEE